MMDTSTIVGLAEDVIDPVKSAVPGIATAALGLFGLIFLIGFIPRLIKRVGNA